MLLQIHLAHQPVAVILGVMNLAAPNAIVEMLEEDGGQAVALDAEGVGDELEGPGGEAAATRSNLRQDLFRPAHAKADAE